MYSTLAGNSKAGILTHTCGLVQYVTGGVHSLGWLAASNLDKLQQGLLDIVTGCTGRTVQLARHANRCALHSFSLQTQL